jgi:tRNA C32,U32 (ribose-2'-O)-methylase TrmJ
MRQHLKNIGKMAQAMELFLCLKLVTYRPCPHPSSRKVKMGIQNKVIPNITSLTSQSHKLIQIHL